MILTIDSFTVLFLGIVALVFCAPIAKRSSEINRNVFGSEISEEAFLRLYKLAGLLFIMGAILTIFGLLPIK
jgi:hypothetical protein